MNFPQSVIKVWVKTPTRHKHLQIMVVSGQRAEPYASDRHLLPTSFKFLEPQTPSGIRDGKPSLIGLRLKPNMCPWKLSFLQPHPYDASWVNQHTLSFRAVVKQHQLVMILIFLSFFKSGGGRAINGSLSTALKNCVKMEHLAQVYFGGMIKRV